MRVLIFYQASADTSPAWRGEGASLLQVGMDVPAFAGGVEDGRCSYFCGVGLEENGYHL
jgi:hypothetical protein